MSEGRSISAPALACVSHQTICENLRFICGKISFSSVRQARALLACGERNHQPLGGMCGRK